MNRMFALEDISKYRQELMGIGIVGVLLSHLVTVGGFDTNYMLVKFLLLFKQLVYTQGFLFLSGFGLYFSLSKNSDFFHILREESTGCTYLL